MDTKKLRQKILDLAIRGKLVPQDPNDEPASVLLEHIRAEKERLIKEGKIKRSKKSATDTSENEALYEVPSNWTICKLEDIAYIGTGATPDTRNKDYYNGNIPWVSSSCTKNDYIDTPTSYISQKAINETNCQIYPNGTLIMAMYGEGKTRGQVGELRIDAATNQACAAIMPYLTSTTQYIKLYLKRSYLNIRQQAEGGLQPNLNLSKIAQYDIPLPPLEEQKSIVNEIERWFALIDILENNEDDLLKAIDKAKSKILDLAIHGKLVPQDPNDEPAIELLKRINPKFEPCNVEDCPFAIPSSWEWTTIGMSSKYKSASIDPSKYKDQDFELYSVPSFETGMPEAVKGSLISSSKKIVKEGDVLVCKINPHLNRIWIVEHHNKDLQCIASSEWIIFRNRDIDSQYLMRCFSSSYFLHLMLSNVSGVGGSLMRAQPASVDKYLFPLPPLAEQKRIVAKIEEVFKALDALS